MSKSIPVSFHGGRLKGEIHPDYMDESFLSFLHGLPDALSKGTYPLLKEREDRLYFAVEADHGGVREEIFVKVDDFTRRIRPVKWLRNFFTPSRAERAWRVAHAFLREGLPTPTPITFLESRRGGCLLRSYLLVQRVSAAEAIHQRYARRYRGTLDPVILKEKEALMSSLSSALALMHARGIFYGDLKASNVLVFSMGESSALTFVDLESARLAGEVSKARRIKDLGSLLCSFLGIFTRRDAFRFIRQYLEASPSLEIPHRVFVNEVYRKAIKRKGTANRPLLRRCGSG